MDNKHVEVAVNSWWQDDMPRPADVVQDDASYLAMGSLIPMDPIRKMPLNVSPHHVMKV